MAIYPVGPQYRDEDEPIHQPMGKVDEHIYRRMEEIITHLETLQSSVARLIDLQTMMGYGIDRLLHADGTAVDGPVIDPQD